MRIGNHNIKVGDRITFEYTGFAKKVGATGKVVSINGTINIAVTAAHVWACFPENLIIKSKESADVSAK